MIENKLIRDAKTRFLKGSEPLAAAERIFGIEYLDYFTKQGMSTLFINDTNIKIDYCFKKEHFVYDFNNGSYSFKLDVKNLADLGYLLFINNELS